MQIKTQINKQIVKSFYAKISKMCNIKTLVILSITASFVSIVYCLAKDYIIAYGDAESHLNISKRVVHGLTPGLAQLGGIWLPLPHILMVPFVYFDLLWRTGLAGSIVSSIFYIISNIIIYQITYILTKNKIASFLGFLVFALNPNILYLQTTPMTEIPLIAFFLLSIYFFIKYIRNESLIDLVVSSLFGFCAALTRYDGWFLISCEFLIIILKYLPNRKLWKKMEGLSIVFANMAFFGIILWLLWDFLILGDPLFFTNSQFSAKSQQQTWLSKGQLPSYHNVVSSFIYYFATSMSNIGLLVFAIAIIGFLLYLLKNKRLESIYISFLIVFPFLFYWFSLFIGQSVIFIPHLTPASYEWRLFNVRYGIMMMPFAAIFTAYLFYQVNKSIKLLIVCLVFVQFILFSTGYSKVMTLADGVEGLSAIKKQDAVFWVKKNYDDGLILLDDYARTLSVIKSGLPMKRVIYVGSKPYWAESFSEPEKYAKWIIMQNEDDVWNNIYSNPSVRNRLFKYFHKVYTSPNILIFKRTEA